ncbi:MAG: hypothetical protein WDN75_00550 [Bacteroidota bacterium]
MDGKKIENQEDVAGYLKEIKIDFLAQQLVDLPLEYGVFYRRYPSEPVKGNFDHGKRDVVGYRRW